MHDHPEEKTIACAGRAPQAAPESQNARPSGHSHTHDPKEKKRQLNRLSRAIGHLEYIKRMIEADEDCSDVLTQISAVRSALGGLGKEIIDEHLSHCIIHAVEEGDMSEIEEFQKAIQKFI